MKKLFVVGGALAVLLSGCSSQTTSEMEASAQSTPSADVESTPEPEDPAISYCRTFEETRQDYLDVVSSIDGPTTELDVAAWNDLDTKLSELDPSGLGKEWVVDHGNYMTMRSQINAVLDAGGGTATFTTTDFKDGSIALMTDCIGAGYKVGD